MKKSNWLYTNFHIILATFVGVLVTLKSELLPFSQEANTAIGSALIYMAVHWYLVWERVRSTTRVLLFVSISLLFAVFGFLAFLKLGSLELALGGYSLGRALITLLLIALAELVVWSRTKRGTRRARLPN